MNVTKEIFGKTNDGEEVLRFTLQNNRNITVKVMTYGGIVTAIQTPAKDGEIADVALGFDTLESYLAGHPFFGVIAGRYANRIADGRFTLNGVTYQLAKNDGKNHLHGGIVGFDKKIWSAQEIRNEDAVGVALTYRAKDGEEGYPGNLDTTVTYSLTDQNELVIKYEAITDRTTVVNLTNHTYFNLRGEGSGDVLGHEMMINAKYYTAMREGLIPTGELVPVAGSPLDFTAPRTIGSRFTELEDGYDHNFCLNKEGGELSLAAEVHEPQSGRMMRVFTTQPGIQFYTANHFSGPITGKAGKVYHKRDGFCLETQHFPDSPNQPDFPSTVLQPGETYKQVTIYQFSTK